MNQMDATTTPIFDCFTDVPDFTPFTAVTNQSPLDQMNPNPKKISDSALRKDTYVSARLPLKKEDQYPEDVFNHILWRTAKGAQTPYPAWAVKTVSDDDQTDLLGKNSVMARNFNPASLAHREKPDRMRTIPRSWPENCCCSVCQGLRPPFS